MKLACILQDRCNAYSVLNGSHLPIVGVLCCAYFLAKTRSTAKLGGLPDQFRQTPHVISINYTQVGQLYISHILSNLPPADTRDCNQAAKVQRQQTMSAGQCSYMHGATLSNRFLLKYQRALNILKTCCAGKLKNILAFVFAPYVGAL